MSGKLLPNAFVSVFNLRKSTRVILRYLDVLENSLNTLKHFFAASLFKPSPSVQQSKFSNKSRPKIYGPFCVPKGRSAISRFKE